MEDGGWSHLRSERCKKTSLLHLCYSLFLTSQVATIHLGAAQMNLLAVRGGQIKNVAMAASQMDTRRNSHSPALQFESCPGTV